MRLVVLDRDGVINHDSDDFITTEDEWRPLKGSAEAIARLNSAGYTVAVATNQSGIGRKLLSEGDLKTIHSKMLHHIESAGGRIDKIVYCPHLPDAGCDCRKPRPGLLKQLQDHYGIDMNGVPFVGDSERDLRAAIAIGARPILVLTGNGRSTLEKLEGADEAIEFYDDLAAVVDAMLQEPGAERPA
jgi:D-glycero-D-manno-heptose 1,7-bisphosphate phosphatase